MAARRIILDCDPGVDDALAIALAVASPAEIELVAVTTVAGNVPLAATTRNALDLLALFGRPDIPVHAGCARPILAAEGYRSRAHGAGGVGGVTLPRSPATAGNAHAVDVIIERVMAEPGAITLCTIGPMTNIALAMIREPRLAASLAGIVFMGGAAFGPGNSTAAAEFNVYVDPVAAHVVLSSGAPLTMFGLDVTRSMQFGAADRAALDRLPGRAAGALAPMLAAYAAADPALHDPCVVAHLVDDSLFAFVDAHLEVDWAPGPNHGRTLAHMSEKHRAGRPLNARIATSGDRDRLAALLIERIGRLG